MTDRLVTSSNRLDRGSGTGAATGLLRATPIAAVLAAIANAIVYAIARAADTLPSDVLVDTPGGKQSIGLLAVIAASPIPSSSVGSCLPCWPGSRGRPAASS